MFLAPLLNDGHACLQDFALSFVTSVRQRRVGHEHEDALHQAAV
jgi:hypothetical protein